MSTRRWLSNLLLAAASVGAFASGAELLARAFELRPSAASPLANPPWLGDRRLLRDDYRERMEQAGVLARYYDLYEWDRFLFYRLRGDRHVELVDPLAPPAARERSRWSVHTNARGFRSPPFGERKPPGTVRIAALGDSSTFGWGVEHFEAYPERLGAALAAGWAVDRPRVEMLNLGVPGYSTFQGRVLLERVALGLEPDVVLWSYLSNDGAVTGAADADGYARRVGPAGALLELLHASRAFETLEAWIGVARARIRPPRAPDPRDATQRNVSSYASSAENMRAAVDLAHAAGVPLVLVNQCTRGPVAQVMQRVARDTGTPYVDATALLDAALAEIAVDPRFAAHRERLRERYGAALLQQNPRWLAFLPDHCHPNALGHRLVGEALADLVSGVAPEPPR